MLFFHPWLLAGLAAITIPVILHLMRKRAAKPVEWGAMRFLLDTVAMRKRRIEWEDMLLMAARCLLVALVALAIARPFVPPESSVPWAVVLPAALLGVAAFGAAAVVSDRKTRLYTLVTAALLMAIAALAVVFEQRLNLKRFQPGAGRDVALVIDASTSMTLRPDGTSSFDHAIAEAVKVVEEAPRGTSFSVVLGGPAPELKTGNPLSRRTDVLEILRALRPVGGPFRAQDALGAAVVGLAQGTHAQKDIIVFTDGQRIGWRMDNPASWKALGDAAASLPHKPKLVLRTLPPPARLRNAAISGISLSREVVGTDRDVAIRVTVANTGTDAITPGDISVRAAGTQLPPGKVGQLVPGQQETIEFRHRFSAPGAQIVEARIDPRDDLPDDDRSERVVCVRKRLPVLLVDGNPGGRFLERAAGFTALALAPVGNTLQGGKPASDNLMEPDIITAADLQETESFDGRAVVVLADMPRLPATAAERLARFVASGGGVLVIAGPRAEPGFYNSWAGGDGALMPARLGDFRTEPNGISPSPVTFDHPALTLFAKDRRSDLGEALVTGYRAIPEAAADKRFVCARFSNGAPFLAARSYGQGRVALACCAFDGRSGNLPARRSFVPFIHELISWLAGGAGVDLNVDAAWQPTAILPGGGGLRGSYFRDESQTSKATFVREASAIDFTWDQGKPADRMLSERFLARWNGRVMPPVSGEYVIDADVEGRMDLAVDGKTILRKSSGESNTVSYVFEAGKPAPLLVTYHRTGANGHLRLLWTPPGGTRAVIPPTAYLPPSNDEDNILASTEAADPNGAPRTARLLAGKSGRALVIDGSALPGLYQFKAPAGTGTLFGTDDGKPVPLAVKRDAAESHIDHWTADDLKLVGSQFDLVEVRDAKDLLALLSGHAFGQELARILAVAALFLLLLESALARWISRSRRTGEDVRIDFEHHGDPDATFLDELGKLRAPPPR